MVYGWIGSINKTTDFLSSFIHWRKPNLSEAQLNEMWDLIFEMFPPRNVVLKSVPCEKLNLRRAVGETCRNLGTEIQPIPWEDWGLCRQARVSYDLMGKSHAWEQKTIVEWKNTWVCIKRWLLEESYLLTWGSEQRGYSVGWFIRGIWVQNFHTRSSPLRPSCIFLLRASVLFAIGVVQVHQYEVDKTERPP